MQKININQVFESSDFELDTTYMKTHGNAPKRLQLKDTLSSGNDNHWLTSARNPLKKGAFRHFVL